MAGERASALVEEWTARARAALAEVNQGVRDTLERLHEGEDVVIDEAFGAVTREEQLELERERLELRELERKAQAAPAPVGGRSKTVLRWIRNKAWGR